MTGPQHCRYLGLLVLPLPHGIHHHPLMVRRCVLLHWRLPQVLATPSESRGLGDGVVCRKLSVPSLGCHVPSSPANASSASVRAVALMYAHALSSSSQATSPTALTK